MKKITLIIIIMLLVFSTNVLAGDWEFNVLGVNPKHFKDRDWKVIIIGAVSSFIVHEASHVLYAEMHGGGHYDWDERVAVMEDPYNSHGEIQMFYRAGFLGQLLVGGTLTAIPKTRHSDFTLGFNSFTTVNTAIYTIGGGRDKDSSDIYNLDHGELEGSIYTVGAGVLTYINIKKEIE